MSRPKPSLFAISVLSFALLFAIGLIASTPAFADHSEHGNARLDLSPNNLNFGNVTVGTTSPSQKVTATNSSDESRIRFKSITTTAPFILTADTCDGSLDAGQMCMVSVACNPTSAGTFKGSLIFRFTTGGDEGGGEGGGGDQRRGLGADEGGQGGGEG